MPQLLTRSGALYPPATTADFPSERWPVSRRNAGRLQPGMVADFASESLAGFNWNSQFGAGRTACSLFCGAENTVQKIDKVTEYSII